MPVEQVLLDKVTYFVNENYLFSFFTSRSAQTGQDDSVWDKKAGQKSGGGAGAPPGETAQSQSSGPYVQT